MCMVDCNQRRTMDIRRGVGKLETDADVDADAEPECRSHTVFQFPMYATALTKRNN